MHSPFPYFFLLPPRSVQQTVLPFSFPDYCDWGSLLTQPHSEEILAFFFLFPAFFPPLSEYISQMTVFQNNNIN